VVVKHLPTVSSRVLLGAQIATNHAIAPVVWLFAAALVLLPTRAFALTRTYALDEGERVDTAYKPSREGADHVDLTALQGETVSFQVVVDAGEMPLSNITIDPPVFVGPGLRPIGTEVFVEDFVRVKARSHDEHDPKSSLAWTAGSRPTHDRMLGALAARPIHYAASARIRSTSMPNPLAPCGSI
jgi:hypothetical protein